MLTVTRSVLTACTRFASASNAADLARILLVVIRKARVQSALESDVCNLNVVWTVLTTMIATREEPARFVSTNNARPRNAVEIALSMEIAIRTAHALSALWVFVLKTLSATPNAKTIPIVAAAIATFATAVFAALSFGGTIAVRTSL